MTLKKLDAVVTINERGAARRAAPRLRLTMRALGWVALALLAITLPTSSAGANDEIPRVTVEIGDSPSMGPAGAPVTMVEFVDFQ